MRWSDSIIDSTDMNLSKLWKIVKDRGVLQFMGSQRIRLDLGAEQGNKIMKKYKSIKEMLENTLPQ